MDFGRLAPSRYFKYYCFFYLKKGDVIQTLGLLIEDWGRKRGLGSILRPSKKVIMHRGWDVILKSEDLLANTSSRLPWTHLTGEPSSE